ncbi:ABC transporter ATP-binding protein [Bdellovibrio svalbardensis]|uniref:ABC transporter ATP-binding protein n=1 Tax=Bdellovibrio svalbardensis TaxID=2972972 RepID=A0ABT6DIM5_9BACT|nr:ABC transporter ATP-binding protein [Bdellovibrio svalbardensis]MDG0816704.1 ABC transporter ATP-binding protein [Bdellovibrio svalbardensis]
MPAISLRVQDLHKKMKKVQALKGLTMDFSANQLHGIIGPEGAGKTTLLRHLMGLLSPDQGKVEYYQDDLLISFSEVRTRCAYMPQTQSLYGDLSIHEHLEFFRTLYRLSDQEYQERRARLLEITRLEEFKDRVASQLSGGMYKKLGLMCAMLAAPKLMLLDEPTNGVDPLSRRDFWELLNQLKEEGITILVTTSYMDEALKCENVHLLFDGQSLMEGSPLEILKAQKCRNFDEVFLRYDSSLEAEKL